MCYLFRYRIVIHGGIDGFSRMFVFLTASDNNRKDTVLKSFVSACATFGLPSRIRVDKGGENADICDVMDVLRGSGRGSAIRGRSVHNQRIERAWVDVWNGVTNLYVDAFQFLTDKQLLNTDNETHIWALHFIYIPRINRDLGMFCQQWNNHPLRTEHHLSPNQLFIRSALQLRNSSLTAIKDLFDTASATTNTSSNIPSSTVLFPAASSSQIQVDNADQVHVSSVQCPLSDVQLSFVKQQINPLDDSRGPLGLELYLELLDILSHFGLA